MRLIGAYIVLNENNWIFHASLQSALMVFDKILIIDGGSTDGTIELIDSFKTDKIEVIQKRYQHDYLGANGLQRNQYLEWLKKNELNSWCQVLDADEVISDNYFKIKDIVQTNPFDVYNIEMIHFIWHLGLIDATYPQHFVNYRLFKVTDKLFYDEVEHPLLKGWNNLGQTNEVKIFHFGYIKGVPDIVKKYNNHIKKSNIHNRDFLDLWKIWHVLGIYPVKPFNDFNSLPSPIKKEIGIVEYA